jgi:hypothetical protein
MRGRDDLTTKLSGTAGPGVVDLTGYPNLTYAPSQWGDGVRVASNGYRVEEIARAADDEGLVDGCRLVARRFGLSSSELYDALRYAHDHPHLGH